MLQITNAFSLSMLDPENVTSVAFIPISSTEAHHQVITSSEWKSLIGHADTARIVGDLLHVVLPADRGSARLADGEILVAQYAGPRLPEGATKLPAGATIKFFRVQQLNGE